MQNTDAAIAAGLPNGETYSTEVGELLFSLQALLIREAEGGRVAAAFPAATDPVEQPRWALDEAPVAAAPVETAPAIESAPTEVPDAIEALEARIKENEEKREQMKQINKLYRAGDAQGLAALGIDLEPPAQVDAMVRQAAQ